jgi:hypothetical protein
MKIKCIKGNIALLAVIVVLLTANLIMTSLLFSKLKVQNQCPVKQKSLPCESVPLNWAVNNYQCANSLLLAMNVTNVKFHPPGTATALRQNRTVFTAKS